MGHHVKKLFNMYTEISGEEARKSMDAICHRLQTRAASLDIQEAAELTIIAAELLYEAQDCKEKGQNVEAERLIKSVRQFTDRAREITARYKAL